MDPQSRKTASAYINNLLLSRGLLRNGTPLEFATPEQAEGGVDATMAQIMNLVHDLILRRDRESDTLASLAQNLQTLRTSSSQHTQTISRLETRSSDLDRRLALTSAQERAARATLRSAETRNRALREEMARLKGTVAQIRAQCATDVRRRDGEVQRLKRHLEGRRGREGNSGQVAVVVVTSGPSKGEQGSRCAEINLDLESPGYSLKQETTEFLTQLSQGLSDENDALIGLVRSTLATLRSLQGLPIDTGRDSEMHGSSEPIDNVNGLVGGPPSYEALAACTDEVLEHLRGLLTNPSFVPLEEVEIREEEIHRLREGWEKMAVRWKEAVALMDGWKKRMVDSGDTINLNDLEMGMDLGSGIPTVQEAQEVSTILVESKADANESDIWKDLEDNLDVPSSPDTGSEALINGGELDAQAADRVLSNKDANARPTQSPRHIFLRGIGEDNSKGLSKEKVVPPLRFTSPRAAQASPTKAKSHVPLQEQPPSSSPTRTIQQKLERAKMEADETQTGGESQPRRKSVSNQQVKRKLRGSRRRSTLSPEELEKLMGLT